MYMHVVIHVGILVASLEHYYFYSTVDTEVCVFYIPKCGYYLRVSKEISNTHVLSSCVSIDGAYISSCDFGIRVLNV